MQADAEQANDLIDQIEEEHVQIARGLRNLVEDYRFDNLMELAGHDQAAEKEGSG